MFQESGERKASHPSDNQNFRLMSATGDESKYWASGTVLCVKSTYVFGSGGRNLQLNKELAAELTVPWAGETGWLLHCCLVRLVFQNLAFFQVLF